MRIQIVRFLETFRREFSSIKTEVLFLYMFHIELLFSFSFFTCHSRILQCVELKNFCSVLLFFLNLRPEYSWIPLKLSLLRFFSVVCLRLYILTKKVSLSKNERVLLYSKTDRLVGISRASPSLSSGSWEAKTLKLTKNGVYRAGNNKKTTDTTFYEVCVL